MTKIVLGGVLLKVKKEDSAIVYFILEANEGICFYSTIPHETHDQFRIVEIKYTKELEKEFNQIINQLKKEIELELTLNQT